MISKRRHYSCTKLYKVNTSYFTTGGPKEYLFWSVCAVKHLFALLQYIVWTSSANSFIFLIFPPDLLPSNWSTFTIGGEMCLLAKFSYPAEKYGLPIWCKSPIYSSQAQNCFYGFFFIEWFVIWVNVWFIHLAIFSWWYSNGVLPSSFHCFMHMCYITTTLSEINRIIIAITLF